jgi:hypothetical protein
LVIHPLPAGKSLGSCPTCYLAGRHAFRGVIIVAGLASGARVLFPTTKLWALDAQFFNNLGHVAGNKSPFQVKTDSQETNHHPGEARLTENKSLSR